MNKKQTKLLLADEQNFIIEKDHQSIYVLLA